jgi:hypothetical protein
MSSYSLSFLAIESSILFFSHGIFIKYLVDFVEVNYLQNKDILKHLLTNFYVI